MRRLLLACLLGVAIAVQSAWGVTPFTLLMSMGGRLTTAPVVPGFTLVSHLEYSPNGGGLTTGTLNCTGANLIVIFLGTYKDWYASSFTDSNGNTYSSGTKYSGTAQAGQFWYCRNPTGNLSALTFTPTGVSGNINLYSYYGIMTFSGGSTSTFDQEAGQMQSAAPMQPGSITPTQNNSLVVTGIFCYFGGSSPTCNSGVTYYGVAASGNIGMGGSGWLAQGSAAAINPTWVGNNGGENAVIIASFKP